MYCYDNRAVLDIALATAYLLIVVLRLYIREGDELGFGDGFVRFAEHPLLEQ